MAGDARRSYDPKVVTAFTRQLLYVRPGRGGDLRPRGRGQGGRSEAFVSIPCSTAVLGRPTLTGPVPAHNGHFLATGSILRAAHGDSALFCQTLLPRRATVRVLGGKGHQFEVNGENCDMYDSWWEKVGTPDYQEEIGIGWWRVEVEPGEPRGEDVFLHVLWATDDGVTAMFPVEAIEAADCAGAKFSVDGLNVTATFATKGDVSGHLRLARHGEVICDRPLAQGDRG